jgi:SnoaL-like domain
MTDTPARRLLALTARYDEELVERTYDEDAVLHTPLGSYRGLEAIASERAEFHEAFSNTTAALHDEFDSEDSTRRCLRLRYRWRHSGTFRGHDPTGVAGEATETHCLTIRDGLITEQVAGVSTFQLPELLLVKLGLEFPWERHDPAPELLSASEAEIDSPGEADTVAKRFVVAFGARDPEGLDEVYAENVELYTPLGWPVSGRDALKAFADEFHAANPGLRIALHDEFYSADGRRACWRIRLHFQNSAPFYGNPPTGERGVMVETHAVTLEEGRIVRQVVGDCTFHMPRQELVAWKMDFPRDTPDPDDVLFTCSLADAGHGAYRGGRKGG